MIETACIYCQQTDTDPKHIHVVGAEDVRHHHDCGALANPPCGVCALIHEDAPKTGEGLMAVGAALREHLVGQPPKWWTHHPDGTVTVSDTEPTGGE